MNKFERNGLCIIGFILFIVALIIGGNYLVNNLDNKTVNESKNTSEIKYLDSNKDIVYYENVNVISEEANLIYRDIKINLDSDDARNVEQKLNILMNDIKGKYELISESDIQEDSILMNYDDILEAKIINYTTYNSSKYLTILVNNYMFYATKEDTESDLSYYIFDKYSGKLLNNELICENEKLTNEDIENKIYEYISSIENINIDETLVNEYTLFYNEYGELMVKILVNIDDITYNDFIKVY